MNVYHYFHRKISTSNIKIKKRELHHITAYQFPRKISPISILIFCPLTQFSSNISIHQHHHSSKQKKETNTREREREKKGEITLEVELVRLNGYQLVGSASHSEDEHTGSTPFTLILDNNPQAQSNKTKI